ncbi:9974_t:CDS:2, partial [Entrophospora sp. SA101]
MHISSNKGYRLGSMRERELEETLHRSLKSISELNDCNEGLQSNYSKRVKAFDREREEWNRDSLRNNTEIQKLRTHALQVINENKQLQNENTNLISCNAQKDISLAESKAENDTKSKKISSLESMIEILEGKLSSAQKDVISIQNDSLKKESEIFSLKSKIAELENIQSELELKVNELERLKSEAISKPIIGGDDEKNMTKSSNISAVIEPSKDLSQYFIREKSMDRAGKIDTIIPDYTDDESTPIPKSPRVNTEIIPKKNYTPSLIESNPQMRPSLEALPLPIGGIGTIPIMANTLMSPFSAYMLLTLLIIAIMWFVLLYKMSSQDNINPNWQKIENDVKTKLIKFLQSDEESISLDINNDQTLIKAGFWVEESSHRPELVSRHIVPLNRYRKSDTQ